MPDEFRKERLRDEGRGKDPVNPGQDELSARRFAGNDNVLCSLSCPFCRPVDSTTRFCTLFRVKLAYADTGNNKICDRSATCRSIP